MNKVGYCGYRLLEGKKVSIYLKDNVGNIISKLCSDCKKHKVVSEFTKSTKTKTGINTKCRDCKKVVDKKGRTTQAHKEYRKKHYLNNKEQYVKSGLTKITNKFGNYKRLGINITQEEYNYLYNKQNRCCAICNKHESETMHGVLHLDHCHKTNKVRGFLCQTCNHGLGLFKDDLNLFIKAYAYLVKAQEVVLEKVI